jgi:hypothetical protein
MLTNWLDQLAHTATLGANSWGDLIVLAIVFILVIGGAIANGLRKLTEKARARASQSSKARTERQTAYDAMRQTNLQAAPRPGQQTPRQRMGASAAEHQAQLEKLRTFKAQQQGRTPASEPVNLTAAQKAARDRARQAYERRAELLARQRQAQEQAMQMAALQNTSNQSPRPTPRQSQPPNQSGKPRPTPPSRSQTQSAPRPQPPRQAQRAQASPSRIRIQRTANATAAGAIPATAAKSQIRQTPAPPKPVSVERLSGQSSIAADSLQVHYHETQHAQKAARCRQLLRGDSLRTALVLREVLDKPVALRDAESQPGAYPA